MLTSRVAVSVLMFAAACGSAAASVDSLSVTTGTWKRADAKVSFREGKVVLALAFEKEAPPKPKPAGTEEGLEGDENAPRITVEVSYEKSPGGGSGNVAGLEGAADSSAWTDDVILGKPAYEAPPDIPLPKERVLTAHAGSASYRVTGGASEKELVPLLKALLSGDPVYYRVRRQYPGELEVAGPKPPVTLYKVEEKPDFYTASRPEQLPDLEYSTDSKTPVIFHFRMREDELSFEKKQLKVVSGPAKGTVRVLLRSAKIGLYADTDAKGVAEFDLGTQKAPGEWRFGAASGAATGTDWQIAASGRAIVRISDEKPEKPELSAPDSESPGAVAAALATAVEAQAGSGGPPPPELVCAIFGQPLESRPALPWKAGAFWLNLARGGKSGPIVDTASWLDHLRDEVNEKWVTRKAEASGKSGTGWTEGQAEKMLSLLRQYELSTDPSRLVEARKEAAKIFPLVLSDPQPEVSRGDAGASVGANALMALALFKANDIFRESSYRRMAFDRVQRLLEQHVDKETGALHAGKAAVTDLRSAALVAQALRKAWRSSSKPTYKQALAAVRKRVLKAWNTKAGGFLPDGGKTKKASHDAQFWALTAFTDSFFPYWDLPGRGWLD